jgi:YD repeat-containing protein
VIDAAEFSGKTPAALQAIRSDANPYQPTLGLNPVVLSTTDFNVHGEVWRTVAYDTSKLSSIPANPRDLISPANINANLVQQVTTTYDPASRPRITTNADGTTTQIQYDNAGRVRKTYDERNSVTELVYDPLSSDETGRSSYRRNHGQQPSHQLRVRRGRQSHEGDRSARLLDPV